MPNWKSHYLAIAPYLVLALSLSATFVAWRALDIAVGARIDQRFRDEAEETTRAIETRLHAYELMLRGGLGLFLGSDGVTRAEFKSYVDILGLRRNYPGIQAFGYAQIVSGAARAAFEGEVREEGFADYAIYPEGERESYVPVLYIEPLDARTRRAMGYDVASEEMRRTTLARARDTGAAAVTPKLRLVQEPREAPQPGFAMFLPFYRGGLPQTPAERQARIVGYLYAPFRMYDLMGGILSNRRQLLGFSVYDGAPTAENLLYASPGADSENVRRRDRTSFQIGGRDWTLLFVDTPAFREASASYAPQAAAAGGAIVSLALFLLTFLLRRMLIERRQAAEAMIETEKKLMQAQKMEAIGHLTGGVAHDFNNLLQVVLGSNDMLVDELADQPRLRAMAELARTAAVRGAELTHRLLAFARKQPLDPRPTDVNSLVAGMDALLRRTLGAQIEIKTVLAADAWPASLDAPQMESAILNLCLNARDAMPSGGSVILETANVTFADTGPAGTEDDAPTPGDYVMVAVSDDGCGMDAATLAKAVEPFFTTKDVGKGSGLGLSMVYGFAKQSRGHVKIYSEPGRGTTVRLYLPRATQSASPVAAANPSAPRGSEKILLVEDDELVRTHVAGQLRDLGYRVVAAESGAAALAALREDFAIDLLFTDIVMPGGMDGRQLAEEARRLRPRLRVLFTSGYTESASLHHGRLERGAPLLQKPYRRGDLARKLRSVLENPVVASSDTAVGK